MKIIEFDRTSRYIISMKPDRWKQVSTIFQSVLKLEPHEREEFLDKACADDPTLKTEIESQLAYHERGENFLGSTITNLPSHLLTGDQTARIEDASTVISGKEPEPRVMVETVPDLLDSKYRLETCIGRGGMGAVYRAFHIQLQRPF